MRLSPPALVYLSKWKVPPLSTNGTMGPSLQEDGMATGKSRRMLSKASRARIDELVDAAQNYASARAPVPEPTRERYLAALSAMETRMRNLEFALAKLKDSPHYHSVRRAQSDE
jgi:hypothetical protein